MTAIEAHGSYGAAQASPGANGWVVTVEPATADAAAIGAALEAVSEAAAWAGGGRLEFWVEALQASDVRSDGAERAGFVAYRDLWQLRCPLPAKPDERIPRIQTRAYTPDDLDAFLEVNNRAFAWHPEQGGRTRDDIESIQREPWYDPDGFRLYEVDGRLAGFCWTKEHRAVDPPLGEIYVIGVDPDFHGRGLGDALTRAGLDWLHGQGLEHGMLYVESDNDAANRTYDRIGFRHHQTNRAFERTVAAAPAVAAARQEAGR
ncbi:MAG: mycothiol synthase [Acidimicrobiales bacterium]|nr:mycothiol synthase [Acidimicrobiales bacterium]